MSAQDLERERKREEALKEIITTEKSYVEGLEHLVYNYVNPLKALSDEYNLNKVLSPKDFKDCFSSLYHILETNHDLKDLLERMYLGNNPAPEFDNVGKIFIQKQDALKTYSSYVNNYDQIAHRIKELMKTNKNFDIYISTTEEKMRKIGVGSFWSYFVTPVQRVPRYILLLKELIKYTDKEAPEYPDVMEGLKAMEAVAAHINACLKAEEHRKKVNFLKANVKKLNQRVLSMFDESVFIHEGKLQMISAAQKTLGMAGKNTEVYVFSTFVLVVGSQKFDSYIHLKQVPVPWIKESEKEPEVFAIVTKDRTVYFKALNNIMRINWTTTLKGVMENLIKENEFMQGQERAGSKKEMPGLTPRTAESSPMPPSSSSDSKPSTPTSVTMDEEPEKYSAEEPDASTPVEGQGSTSSPAVETPTLSTPAETPVETPVETPAETPVESPAESTPAETPVTKPPTPRQKPEEQEVVVKPATPRAQPVEKPAEEGAPAKEAEPAKSDIAESPAHDKEITLSVTSADSSPVAAGKKKNKRKSKKKNRKSLSTDTKTQFIEKSPLTPETAQEPERAVAGSVQEVPKVATPAETPVSKLPSPRQKPEEKVKPATPRKTEQPVAPVEETSPAEEPAEDEEIDLSKYGIKEDEEDTEAGEPEEDEVSIRLRELEQKRKEREAEIARLEQLQKEAEEEDKKQQEYERRLQAFMASKEKAEAERKAAAEKIARLEAGLDEGSESAGGSRKPKKLSKKELKLQELEITAEELEAKLETQIQIKEEVEKQYNKVSKEKASVEQMISQLQKQKVQLERSLRIVEEEMQRVEEEQQERNSSKKESVERFKSELAEEEDTYNQTEEHLDLLEMAIEKRKRELAQVQQQLGTYKEDNKTKAVQLKNLSDKFKTLTQDLAQAKERKTKLAALVEMIKYDTAKEKQLNKKLNEEYERQLENNQSVSDLLDQRIHKSNLLKTSVEKMQQRLKEIREELSGEVGSMEMKQSASSLREQCVTIGAEYEKMVNARRTIEEFRREATNKLRKQQFAQDSLADELSHIDKQFHKNDLEIRRLTKNLELEQARNNNVERQVKKIKQEYTDAKNLNSRLAVNYRNVQTEKDMMKRRYQELLAMEQFNRRQKHAKMLYDLNN